MSGKAFNKEVNKVMRGKLQYMYGCLLVTEADYCGAAGSAGLVKTDHRNMQRGCDSIATQQAMGTLGNSVAAHECVHFV